MKQVILLPAAAADIEDALRWYERRRAGLGIEFLAALRATFDFVQTQPEAFPVLHRNTRRAVVPRRFPYAIFFRVYDETVVVVACLHVKRRPEKWRSRQA